MRPFVYLSSGFSGSLADGIGDDLPQFILAHGHIQKMTNDILVFGLQFIDALAQLLERLVPDLENNRLRGRLAF